MIQDVEMFYMFILDDNLILFSNSYCSPTQTTISLPEINLTTRGGSIFPVNDPIFLFSLQVKYKHIIFHPDSWTFYKFS